MSSSSLSSKLQAAATGAPQPEGALARVARAVIGARPTVERKIATENIVEREQSFREAASAAGSTRFENDYDLLGLVGNNSVKRRNVSRTLLGN